MSGMNNNFSRNRDIAVDGQSLLSAINRFVQAVDAMDDTVMIPCRLRDILVESGSMPNPREENNNNTTNNNKAVVPAMSLNGDLYHFYVMLHAIRSEIIAGPNINRDEQNIDSFTDGKDNENDPISENAKKTAASFRYHLRGLFGVLHQLTETAKFLGTRYEREVSSTQNGVSSISSFNM